ncbi:unnamed protein product [Camellia sinensis]
MRDSLLKFYEVCFCSLNTKISNLLFLNIGLPFKEREEEEEEKEEEEELTRLTCLPTLLGFN